MNIKDLKPRQSGVEVEGEVTEIEEPREFNKFGRTLRVVNATIKDGSGSIKLTLWNDDIDKVKVGDKIKITNGYVNEFQSEPQLTTGKFGKLEIAGGEASESTEESGEESAGKPDEESAEESGEESAGKPDEESAEESGEESAEEAVM